MQVSGSFRKISAFPSELLRPLSFGRTLFEVQSILGHSSPVVTQRYSHLSTKSLAEAANSASIAIQKGMLSGT